MSAALDLGSPAVDHRHDGLYRVSAHTQRGWVVYGLVVEQGRIVRCAPYAQRWALGRDIHDVVSWLRAAMHWRIEWLK